jgi:hypothetical protein
MFFFFFGGGGGIGVLTQDLALGRHFTTRAPPPALFASVIFGIGSPVFFWVGLD